MPPAKPVNELPLEAGTLGALTTIGRLLIAAFGGLYTAGLLIVNIDLASYGVSNLDLARPEYVMAGTLWVSVTAPGGMLGVVFYGFAHEHWRRRERGKALASGSAGIVLAIGLPVIVLGLFSQPPADNYAVTRHLITMSINVGVIVMATRLIMPTIQSILKSSEWNIRALGAGLTTVFVTLTLVVMLLAYAILSFPLVSREFGGGHKTTIELVLAERAPASWESLGVSISADRSRIRPVILLFESQSNVVVALHPPPPVPNLRSFRRLVAGTGLTPPVASIAIERKSVAVIVYKGPATVNE